MKKRWREKKAVCDICAVALSDKYTLSNHRMVIHGIKEPLVQPKPNSTNKCTLCNKSYVRRLRLVEHMKKAHDVTMKQRRNNVGPYCCDIDFRRFTTKRSLEYHMASEHGIRPLRKRRKPIIKEGLYTCPLCGMGLTTTQSFKRHIVLFFIASS